MNGNIIYSGCCCDLFCAGQWRSNNRYRSIDVEIFCIKFIMLTKNSRRNWWIYLEPDGGYVWGSRVLSQINRKVWANELCNFGLLFNINKSTKDWLKIHFILISYGSHAGGDLTTIICICLCLSRNLSNPLANPLLVLTQEKWSWT